MAHKVHPKAFRLKETKDWSSRWFDKKNFQKQLEEDYILRTFLEKKLKDAGLEHVEMEKFRGKLTIILFTSRPGLIIGRGGSGVELIKKEIQKKTPVKDVRIEIREIKNPWESAALSAQFVASQLERRMPARRTMKQSLAKMMAVKGTQGARVEIAGRLGGAEIARREWLKQGKLPRQTLRADIDYGFREAMTRYGTIGVKVWLYKGEKFD
ncbi:MAG: 30S ribosomal protein S3 [Candidatus Wildermuthbacteria bacterium RIFCSPLOWO2_01_FULL_47_18]|uniref:Small ribosomal subunit protein uS3 n=2 Tax=Candidatus Wildermuthiibacteriota TaxID=1817923 RepID=A0A1G2RFZ7_9BACT|nr:MAG: 30S ribosomal protein S3 [Candidatus Wildermuthbacteria bacterium RIFCSPHIGHO2_02_FULL_48_16]OHA71755.1 MAG: 30S ribosomal protein S3 [Candidatus Wildermuthbacteria bacterium RIFCSPLOWO2_01_FULL_47_18]